MPNLATPLVSALASIDAPLLLSVSGGCRSGCCSPQPPPDPVPTAQTMEPPPQTAVDSVVNSITITNASGTTTRTA